MPKTIHRAEYGVILSLIKANRRAAGLTQADCSKALGHSQSFMSDVERGHRRLDVVQLRDLCKVLGSTLPTFVQAFEQQIRRRRGRA
jgi:transcriptional regulator with XRE-family HTH domain